MPYKITTGKDGKPEAVVTGFDPAKAKNPTQGAASETSAPLRLAEAGLRMLPGGDVGVSAAKGAAAGAQELFRTGNIGKAQAAYQQGFVRDVSANASPITRMAVKGARDLTQSVLGNLPADEFARTGWAPPRKPGAPDAPILGVMAPLPKVKTKGGIEDVGAGLIQAGVGWFLASKGLGRVGAAAVRAPGVAGATGAASRAAAVASQEVRVAAALAPKPVGAAISVAAKVGKKTGEIVLKGAPAGAIVDYAAFDPSESGQLLDGATKWIDKLPDPLRDAAHNLVLSAPGDTAADARWKSAVGGFMVLGPAAAGVIEGLGYSARAIRRVHQARVANRPPEPPTGGTPAAAPETPAAAQTVDVTAAPAAPPKAPPKGPAPAAPKAPARAVGIAQQYQEMRPRQPLWEKTEVQTQGTLGGPAPTVQQAEVELREAIDAVDTAIAKASSTVPDELGAVPAVERGNVMPSYSQVRETPVGDITTDPTRLQFKAAGIGKTGTTGSLKSAASYDPLFGKIVSVWRDPQTNQLLVVNGHNQLDLARRSGTKSILTWEIDAATAEEARAIGAMENIAEGQGTPWDAAKIMRDMGINAEEMVRRNIDVTKGVAEKGVALSRLPQDVFEQGVTGKLTLDKAVALGSEKLDDAVVRDVAAAATKNGWSAEKILQAMQEAKFAQTSGPSGGGVLPGFESMFTTSNFGTMLDVRTEAFKALREEMTALTSLAMAGRKGVIESAGNVVNVAGSQAAKGQAQVAVDVFNRVTGYTGPVRDLLNEMVGQVGGKRTAKAVVKENLGRLKVAIEDEMKGPRLPLEQAAPAPSVPSAGTPAPAPAPTAPTPPEAPRTAVQPMGNVAAAAVEPPAPTAPARPTINLPESASRRVNPNTPARTESAAESLFSWTSSPLPGAKPVFHNFYEALAAVRAKDRILDIDAVPGLDMDAARNDKALGKVTPATQAVANAYEQFYGGGGRAELTSEAVRRIMPDELPDALRADPDLTEATKKLMVDTVRRIAGDDIAITFEDGIVLKPGSKAHGTEGKIVRTGGGYGYEGIGDPIEETMSFHEMGLLAKEGQSAVDYTKDKLEVAAHEAFHAAQLRYMSSAKLRVLNTAFAKLKLYFAAKNRQARARGAKPRPIETTAQAYESFDQAAEAGVSPGAVILGMSPDDVKFFTNVDPKNPLLKSMGASDRVILSGAKAILAGVKLVDDMFDYMEKLYNAMRGRGWTSIRSIFEEAASGRLKESGLTHVKSWNDMPWDDAKEWAQRVKELDRLGAPGMKADIEFAKGEGLLSERATLASEQPVEPQGPRPVDPPPGPENSDDWVRNFARVYEANRDALIRKEITIEDLMANNFQKVQSPSGDTVYTTITEDLVSGYNAMSKVLPDRPTESGRPVMNVAETQAQVQSWFYRHGADQELVDNGLMPVIRAFNEYQAGSLNRAMALADKKQVEASMEAAMWLNSASVDGVNQSERLARLVTAAEAARASHQTVMRVTRPWGQMGLEMQMRRDYDIPPATGAPVAPTPAPVLPPELQTLDVGEEIRRGLEDESTRPIDESFSDELREAATGGEITPRAQAEADAIAQTLVDTGADPTIRTKTWGNMEALRDSGQNGANPLLMLRTNNLISSGITTNVNLQNGLLNLIRLPLTQTTGALAQGEIKRAMYSMMAFQQYWMNLSNAFRIAGHAFKAGRSLMNMDANTLDFMDRIAAKDAQGELLQGPDARTGWTINTVDMSEEMARKPLGKAINGLWQVLGTGASRVSITIDTFNSTLAGYAYEHVRHLPRGMEQAVERGMVEFSPEAWRFAQQYADTRTQATMRDAAINGKNLADVAMESPHAKNFMNAVNFTDDVWAEMQPRTLAEGIEAGQSQGLKGNELQDFAKKYVEEGQLNHRLANYALNGLLPFGRIASLPGQTMATLSEAKFIGPVFKFLQPFQRVPSNIIKSAMRGTPAAVFVDTFWRDINSADPFTRDRAIGEIAVGSGALALVALGTTMGHLRFNGGGPVTDPAAMRKWTDIEGRMPYSVQYWDEAAGTWSAATSMQALEPFATIFGAIGDYNDLANSISSDQRNRLGSSLVMTLARMTTSEILSKSYFQGINEIYEAAFNPSKILVGPGQRDPLARFLQRIAASMVPHSSALRAARREVDPVARTVDPSDAGGLMGFWEETLGEIRNAVPGYSEGLPARRDFINGQPILTPGILGGEMIPADMPWLQGAMQFSPLSAYRQVRKSLGPVHQEMALLSGTGTSFMGPSATDFGANARLTPSELETYVETFANVKDEYGRNFELAVTQLIESDQYRSWPLVAPDPRDVSLRAAAIQAEIQVFKNLAKEQFKAYTPKGQAIAAEEAAAKGRQMEADYIRQYGMDNSPQPAQTGGSWSPTPGNR